MDRQEVLPLAPEEPELKRCDDLLLAGDFAIGGSKLWGRPQKERSLLLGTPKDRPLDHRPRSRRDRRLRQMLIQQPDRPRLSGWMNGVIVADRRVGADTIIEAGFARAVSVVIAEEHIRACPHFVAGTFAMVAG